MLIFIKKCTNIFIDRELFQVNIQHLQELDITNCVSVFVMLETVQSDVVFHGAAYTKVDLAENEERNTNQQINVNGTQNVADAAKLVEAQLVAVSTDYVLDGKNLTDYREADLVINQQMNWA